MSASGPRVRNRTISLAPLSDQLPVATSWRMTSAWGTPVPSIRRTSDSFRALTRTPSSFGWQEALRTPRSSSRIASIEGTAAGGYRVRSRWPVGRCVRRAGRREVRRAARGSPRARGNGVSLLDRQTEERAFEFERRSQAFPVGRPSSCMASHWTCSRGTGRPTSIKGRAFSMRSWGLSASAYGVSRCARHRGTG